MKIHFKLSRAEYESLTGIVVAYARTVDGDGFVDVLLRETLADLGLKMWRHSLGLKERGNSLTPSPAEALALWHTLCYMADGLPPYEQGLALRLLADMDHARLDALRAENLQRQPVGVQTLLNL